jgi:hypothetical protein
MRGGAGSMDLDLSRAQWKKSSYSGNCIEVAQLGQAVAIRDSKDPEGPVLVVTPGEWQELLFDLKICR